MWWRKARQKALSFVLGEEISGSETSDSEEEDEDDDGEIGEDGEKRKKRRGKAVETPVSANNFLIQELVLETVARARWRKMEV